MKIHEYQAKELFAAAGANTPRHIVVRTPDEAAAAFDQLGGTGAMVKAQIHAGGRGAGQLKGYVDKLGGVKFVPTREKAKAVAAAMLAHPLVTLQTGPEGQPIQTLIVQADAEPAKEFYVAVVFDRGLGLPDGYPFVLSEPALTKLRFVHDTIAASAWREKHQKP